MSWYVALALAVSALTVVGVNQAPQAHALSGRRLCMYVDAEHTGSEWRFVVMNYKKRGRCPVVDQGENPDLVTGDPNDVHKRTCEEVSSYVGYADDICRVLEEDVLYELLFDDRTMLPATRNRLGHISEFT